MTTHLLCRALPPAPRLRLHGWSATAALLLSLLTARSDLVCAQIIQIKTLPVADGEQWRFFPSANLGLGGLSIALADSLLDPFENPAKGARLSAGTTGLFFGSPTSYSVSRDAGGGRTLPLGGIVRSGSTFGGVAVAIQEIDDVKQPQRAFPIGIDVVRADGTVLPAPATPSRQNQFAFATIGRSFTRTGVSVGASVLWSGLNKVDGVDLLYAGSRNVIQHGGALDVRLGLLKEWSGRRSLEAIVLHDRFGMTHDVTWADQVWDPNARRFASRARFDRNLDQTNTWGLHLGYTQPLADTSWRVGAIVTTNLMSHPKLPDYQISQVMTIPWDPGHSAAYDLGIGISRSLGLTTFGIDAIYEPIRTHTWGETPDSIPTRFGTIPVGGKTTENFFRFSNGILRTGVGREFPLDTVRVSVKSLRLELGLALRSIGYTLEQFNHVSQLGRLQRESWMEWTRTWGIGLRFTDLEVRYVSRTTTGTGRPGVFSAGGDSRLVDASFADAGKNFLAPPSGPTTLTGVALTTHQLSVSIPLRDHH